MRNAQQRGGKATGIKYKTKNDIQIAYSAASEPLSLTKNSVHKRKGGICLSDIRVNPKPPNCYGPGKLCHYAKILTDSFTAQ
jgi:hypothetical protein